jgi:hypothetical protein
VTDIRGLDSRNGGTTSVLIGFHKLLLFSMTRDYKEATRHMEVVIYYILYCTFTSLQLRIF